MAFAPSVIVVVVHRYPRGALLPGRESLAASGGWSEAVAVVIDGNSYMGMNGTKGVERYERR
jgi:hypothetical protein